MIFLEEETRCVHEEAMKRLEEIQNENKINIQIGKVEDLISAYETKLLRELNDCCTFKSKRIDEYTAKIDVLMELQQSIHPRAIFRAVKQKNGKCRLVNGNPLDIGLENYLFTEAGCFKLSEIMLPKFKTKHTIFLDGNELDSIAGVIRLDDKLILAKQYKNEASLDAYTLDGGYLKVFWKGPFHVTSILTDYRQFYVYAAIYCQNSIVRAVVCGNSLYFNPWCNIAKPKELTNCGIDELLCWYDNDHVCRINIRGEKVWDMRLHGLKGICSQMLSNVNLFYTFENKTIVLRDANDNGRRVIRHRFVGPKLESGMTASKFGLLISDPKNREIKIFNSDTLRLELKIPTFDIPYKLHSYSNTFQSVLYATMLDNERNLKKLVVMHYE